MQSEQKILFLSEGQLGDLLLLTPAINALKKSKPNACITVLIFHRRKYNGPSSSFSGIEPTKFEGTAEVFSGNSSVSEVIEVNRYNLRSLTGITKIRKEWECISYLRKEKFDAVICTFPEDRFLIWSFLAGIPLRIGQKNQQLRYLLTDKPDIDINTYGVLKYFYELLKPLGVDAECNISELNVTNEEKESAKKILESKKIDTGKAILCIHPGASEAHKVWPAEYYAKVIDYVAEKDLMQSVICSDSYTKSIAGKIQEASNYKAAVIETNKISELASIFSLSELCIVNNSGPRHLAAFAGIKNIAVFQKYEAARWKIYDDDTCPVIYSTKNCSACLNNKCESIIKKGEQLGSLCLWDLEPQAVIDKINEYINKNH